MKKSNKDTLQSYLDSFSVMISEDEIIDALDDEKWENDVVNAAFYGALYFGKKENTNPDEIINKIIIYNTLKKIRELFISKSKPLPKKFILDNMSLNDAFFLLENHVMQVVILNEAEKLDKQITLDLVINDESIKNSVIKWYSDFQDRYKSIKICVKSKDLINYKVTFKNNPIKE